ncbi:hypothetical protein M2419_005454 [Sphingobacterium sp. BIGb0116]|nr:hypothetical protein [Sphingobacterium sp. BIGb0116]
MNLVLANNTINRANRLPNAAFNPLFTRNYIFQYNHFLINFD